MASAVPRYQDSPVRICGGTRVMKSPHSELKIDQPSRRCFCRECDLYWVKIKMRRRPECRQLLSVKSMMRYLPPKGTAGLARSAVSGCNREPTPPAKRTVNVFSRLPIVFVLRRTIRSCVGVIACPDAGIAILRPPSASRTCPRLHGQHSPIWVPLSDTGTARAPRPLSPPSPQLPWRPVYEDDRGRYVIDDEGEPVYRLWLVPKEPSG